MDGIKESVEGYVYLKGKGGYFYLEFRSRFYFL